MRRINGSGSVYKLKDKPRHKPWVAMSSKKNAYGVTEKHVVGYYATKKEAVSALDAYNLDPYALGPQKTLNDVFSMWIEEFSYKASPLTVRGRRYAYNFWEPFFERPIREIRPADLQHHLDTSDRSLAFKRSAKQTISSMYEFAVRNDYAPKNIGRYLYVPEPEKKNSHTPYTDAEIGFLWKHSDDDIAALQLVLIYSGCRIGEILDLDMSDVDLKERTFRIRKAKTASGVRIVPIADRTLPLWQRFANRGTDRIITSARGLPINYVSLRARWSNYCQSAGMDHSPHDCRHTAVTRMTAAGVDDRIIKKVVGHKARDVTIDVYTHADLEQLRDAVNRI